MPSRSPVGLPEIFVGAIQTVPIVQPSLRSSLESGTQHVLATLVGCAIGVTTMWAAPHGHSLPALRRIARMLPTNPCDS